MKHSSIIILSSVLAFSSMNASAQINKINDTELSKVSGQLKTPSLNIEPQKIIKKVAVRYVKNKIKNKVRSGLTGLRN
ncbi:MAG: hypothetical protein KUG80_03715 [Gammaproteobacteria bacterium]|nr:hypothetical protein [Gammaproteobacteria bacterium]